MLVTLKRRMDYVNDMKYILDIFWRIQENALTVGEHKWTSFVPGTTSKLLSTEHNAFLGT